MGGLLSPASALGGCDAGMAALAQGPEIVPCVSATVCQRDDVVDFCCRRRPAFPQAHLAQGGGEGRSDVRRKEHGRTAQARCGAILAALPICPWAS